MKVLIQVINTKTNLLNSGTIEEPVKKGLEIANALKHFGVIYGEVSWDYNNFVNNELDNIIRMMSGHIPNTSKVVTVVAYE